MLKHPATLIFLLSITTTLAHGNTFNGKTTGMSDAGVATANYLEGVLLNPAALATFDDSDDLNFHVNVGALATDEDELLENAEELSDALDAVSNRVPTSQQVDELVAQLETIRGKTASVEAGGGVFINIPSDRLSVGLYGNTTVIAGVIADVSDNDITLLQNAFDTLTPVDTDLLESSIFASGAMITDIGITFAHQVGDISYGVTPKHQEVEIIEYRTNVDNYDEDDFDAAEYTTEDSNFNLDIGVQQVVGKWRVGATLVNAIEHTYKSISGREIKIEPRLTTGIGYRNDWLTAALDVDANATPNLITDAKSQFARVGLAMDAGGWAQLRLGYKTDMKSKLEDTYSVGIGFSPFGVMNLDISAVSGDNDTVGGAVQLGFSF